ncbi:MAG: hypothetical protein CMH52_07760 [Myxococcales bacterium]|nr:hypothetical protein [Myxococcales bacterium]
MLGGFAIPQRIGQYELGKRIGNGSMGIVYLGTHVTLGRKVAVKLRHRESRSGEKVLAERFSQGARLQAELRHPAIALIHEYVETDSYQAMMIEYLAGGSVEDLLKARGGRLDAAAVLDVGVRLARAIECAHGQGVIHRDIKPANVLFKNSNVPSSVRLSDFGVAKAPERSPDLTVVGASVGTLWYMPPEQFSHSTLDGRADIYALGATLYEMLTGHVPFDRLDTSEVFRRFLDGAPLPPIQKRNASIPDSMAAVIEACLAIKPEDRIPSAGTLAALLEGVIALEGLRTSNSAAGSDQSTSGADELDAVLAKFDDPVADPLRQTVADLGFLKESETQTFRVYEPIVQPVPDITAFEESGLPIILETVEQRRWPGDQDDFDDDDQTIVTALDDGPDD